MTTPAGWYPDPSNSTQQRYWDGNGWTEHVHPLVQAQPEQAGYTDPGSQASAGWGEQAAQAGGAYGEQAGAQAAAVATGQQAWGGAAEQQAQQEWGGEQAQQGWAEAGQQQAWAGGAAEQQQAWAGAAGEQQQAWGGAGVAEQQAQAWGGAEVAEQPQQQQAWGAEQHQQQPQQDWGGQQAAATGDAGAWGVGGIHTDLLSDQYAEVGSGQRVTLQNKKLLKVTLGADVLARQGSMVAFQGSVDFDHEGAGAARFLKKALTGEGLPLMRCHGQGELFLADAAKDVHIIHLDNAGLSVNGRNVLAFEPSLSWDIARVQGASMVAGGLFNTRLQGTGWVAITTKGQPVVLRTDQPTFVDTDAVVAWSAGLQTTLRRSVKMKAIIGKGSGEAVQLAFQGTGIVIVQPSEGDVMPTAKG